MCSWSLGLTTRGRSRPYSQTVARFAQPWTHQWQEDPGSGLLASELLSPRGDYKGQPGQSGLEEEGPVGKARAEQGKGGGCVLERLCLE